VPGVAPEWPGTVRFMACFSGSRGAFSATYGEKFVAVSPDNRYPCALLNCLYSMDFFWIWSKKT
jgi:hypothetical protein